MLVGEAAVLKYMDLTKCKHFRIYRGTGGPKSTPVFYYEDGGGVEVAKTQFTNWCQLMNGYTQPIEYMMTIYPKGKPTGKAAAEGDQEGGDSKDTIRTTFYLVSPNGASIQANNLPANPQAAMIGGVETREQMEARIRKELEMDMEMDDLYDEIDELKKSQTDFQSGFQKIIGYVLPLLEGDPSALMNKAAGIASPGPAAAPAPQPRATHLAGVEEAPEGTLTKEDIIRLNDAVSRLFAKDPYIVDHLDKLASVAENNPAFFNQMLSMLNAL